MTEAATRHAHLPGASRNRIAAAAGLSVALVTACSGRIDAPGQGNAGGQGGPLSSPGAGGRGQSTGGGNASGSGGTGVTAACALPPARVWRLTPDQLDATVKAVLGTSGTREDLLPTAAAKRTQFSNEAAILELTEPHTGKVLDLADRVGAAAAKTPAMLAPCLATSTDKACLQTFVDGFASRAFRRDVTATERDALVTFGQEQITALGKEAGLAQVVAAILGSPSFLFRTELGAEDRNPDAASFPLTGFERANALSYFLTDGPPDAQLSAAARDGSLMKKETLASHARRLLASPSAAPGLSKLFAEQYQFEDARSVSKDAKAFPEWTPTYVDGVVSEARSFVNDWFWSSAGGPGGKLPALFTTRVPGKEPQRIGLITLAATMARLAHDDDTSPVGRGKFIREMLLCQQLPPPPPNVAAVPPKPDGQHTQRERLAVHSADKSCAACHHEMDPLGLAFETFDAIGKYRTQEAGKTIDPSGTLTGASPEGAAFADGAALSRLLADSPDVASCFVRSVFRYAYGRDAEDSDACAIESLTKTFEDSGRNAAELLVTMVSDDHFVTRRAH